jgi:RHS repeat-associated protein
MHLTLTYPVQSGGCFFTRGNVRGYCFGFNGKERDDEGMGGGGSTYDYGFRIYNPQIARFLSVDPLTNNFPFYTPYQYASNTPVQAIDLDGLEGLAVVDHQYRTTTFFVTLVSFKGNGLSRADEKRIVRNMEKAFKRGGVLYDKNNIDENGKPYRVCLKINLVEVPSVEEAYTKVGRDIANNPASASMMILERMIPEVTLNADGSTSTKEASSSWGRIQTSTNNGHSNLHELFHNFIHNHPLASDRLKNLIDRNNQEPGHLVATGIFVYANSATGQALQSLNQQNVDDALNTLPKVTLDINSLGKLPSVLGSEKPSE